MDLDEPAMFASRGLKPVAVWVWGRGRVEQIVPSGQVSAMGLLLLLPWKSPSPSPGSEREAWSRLLISTDTGRGSRSQPDSSWQPHLHKSLIV